MHSRVPKIFIGKSVSRTASVTPFPSAGTYTATPAVGEILILDKNKAVMVAGTTYAESNEIYIAETLSETYSIVTEAGTSIANIKRILLSDAINGKNVNVYTGKAYVAKAEKTASVTFGTTTVTIGTEYVIRIVYKDIKEHPGQFTHTYRVIATDTDATTLVIAFKAKINADSKTRVVASNNVATTLVLTGMPIPSCTSSLNNIDEFYMVDFEVFEYYVATSGERTSLLATSAITYTEANYGIGTWEQVRDAEKHDLVTRGITNNVQFPVITPDFRTVKSTNYDTITIEFDQSYEASNLLNYKETPKLAKLFIVDGAAQTTNILAALNPWMASTPKGFDNVTV